MLQIPTGICQGFNYKLVIDFCTRMLPAIWLGKPLANQFIFLKQQLIGSGESVQVFQLFFKNLVLEVNQAREITFWIYSFFGKKSFVIL